MEEQKEQQSTGKDGITTSLSIVTEQCFTENWNKVELNPQRAEEGR
jgi:hypothetical protein